MKLQLVIPTILLAALAQAQVFVSSGYTNGSSRQHCATLRHTEAGQWYQPDQYHQYE